jgi:glycosyltransferase involved in cell wall biosynthesis
MFTLSIITIVKDDYEGLVDTIGSVEDYALDARVQHVVWICASSKNLDIFRSISDSTQRKVLIDNDQGIWDAMNKAIGYASGKLFLFLNAKDVLTTPLDITAIHAGCLLPVEYVDWFGRLRKVNCSRTLRLGIPYCHQGVIFPNLGTKYDIRYKFGADYLYILDCFKSWPPPLVDGPIVRYDNSGVSSDRRLEADIWSVRCVYARFGLLSAIYVLVRSIAKFGARCALWPVRGLLRRAFGGQAS